MHLKTPVRADARALAGSTAVGAAMGILLGAAYLAGGAARTASVHAHANQLAMAAANGFSEAALRAEAATMEPGALAIARRHDPLTGQGSAARDRQTALLASQLEPAMQATQAQQAPAPAAQPMLRAAYSRPVAPARPLRMSNDNPLDGARELDCLSAAVYYEARGESGEGQAAVAQVVLNRVRHPAFPKSVCAVVYQGAQSHDCQFSFACNGAMRARKDPVSWRRAQAVAARALSGFVMTAVGDATNFHAARLGGMGAAGLLKVAQVGAHVFYRFSGRAAATSAVRAAPDLYVPPSSPRQTADGESSSSLILASAVTTPPSAIRAATSETAPPMAADSASAAAAPGTTPGQAVVTALR